MPKFSSLCAILIFATLPLGCSTDSVLKTGQPLAVEPLAAGDVVAESVYQIWFDPKTTIHNPTKIAQYDLDTNTLVLRINGKLERLSPRYDSWTAKRASGGRIAVGESRQQVWGNAHVTVKISSVLVAAKYSEDFFDGQMDVSSKGVVLKIPVKGYYGS